MSANGVLGRERGELAPGDPRTVSELQGGTEGGCERVLEERTVMVDRDVTVERGNVTVGCVTVATEPRRLAACSLAHARARELVALVLRPAAWTLGALSAAAAALRAHAAWQWYD